MQEPEKPPRTNARLRGNSPSVQVTSRTLRRGLTPAEKKLWQALRDRKFGNLKFRRQHPVGRFILDFYCPAHNLVVEVDGGVHDAQVERDMERTLVLQEYGYLVIRFRNEEVLEHLEAVLAAILAAATKL